MVTLQQFPIQDAIGGGGTDRLLLTDGANSDLLVLNRSTLRLTSQAYEAQWSDIDRVTATSLMDTQIDRIQRDSTLLDYLFEKVGDWL